MISEGVGVAMLGRTSHGLYAGRFKQMIEGDYQGIVEASLKQEITDDGLTRGHFFKNVIIAERHASALAHQLQTTYWGN